MSSKVPTPKGDRPPDQGQGGVPKVWSAEAIASAITAEAIASALQTKWVRFTTVFPLFPDQVGDKPPIKLGTSFGEFLRKRNIGMRLAEFSISTNFMVIYSVSETVINIASILGGGVKSPSK